MLCFKVVISKIWAGEPYALRCRGQTAAPPSGVKIINCIKTNQIGVVFCLFRFLFVWFFCLFGVFVGFLFVGHFLFVCFFLLLFEAGLTWIKSITIGKSMSSRICGDLIMQSYT